MSDKKWPETRLEKLTNVAMTAFETCEMMTKVKIIIRQLHHENNLEANAAQTAELIVNEFINNLKAQAEPEKLVNVDELFGRLVAFAVKSCLKPEGIFMKIERPTGESH